jgi:rubredoxin-NAD+ reductase
MSQASISAKAPIVIIGTGLSGYTLAKEFRKYDQETPLLFLTSDDGCCYSKPMISTGFTKNKSAEQLAMLDAGAMAEQLKASIRTMVKVTAIDTVNHEVAIGDEKIAYSKLVIAWGAECIHAPLQGDGIDRVHSINDLIDYAAFRRVADGRKKALIIGAGLIGSEYANDLANGGFDIEAVDPLNGPLATLLPPQVSQAVQHAMERELNVVYHFGTVVETIDKKGDGIVATLANGQKVEADFAVSAIGVRPRIALARKSGLAVNRGIVVNRKLETSAPDVYALGDCAEVDGHVLYYVMPLMACARVLAKTLAGEPTDVAYGAMPVGVKLPACPVQVSPPARGVEGEWHIEADGDNVRALFRNKAGELLGFALTGKCAEEKMKLAKELPAIIA